MNRLYEELALNAWPALITHHYDGWLIKYANGYTKRANSVYPLYDSTVDVEDKIDYCEAYYSAMGQKTTFKMNDSDMLRVLDMCLEDRGYHVLDPTDVMVMPLSGYEPVELPEDYEFYKGYSEEWTNAYAGLVGLDNDDEQKLNAKRTLIDMLMCIKVLSINIIIREDDEIIAVGNAVLERGYLGVFNIVVKESYRGKGYGHKTMNAIIKEGQKLGAVESYLQVVCENQVAVNMYKKMGYEKLYTYWYRRRIED